MIEQVEDFSEKSWHNYTGPEEGFKKKNIFFGYNGKGKSALASGILSQIKKTTSNQPKEPNYRFFNRNYVMDSLALENGSKIEGVVADFGKKNVDIGKAINKKENEKSNVSQLEDECTAYETKIRDEVNRIFNEKKGKSSIKRKSSNDVFELLRFYQDDLKKARNIADDEELLSAQEESQYEEKLQNVQSVQLPKFSFPDDKDIENISVIMGNKYDDTEIPTKVVIDWIQDGVNIHKNNHVETCQFCGSPLHLNDIEAKLNSYLDTRKQKDQTELESQRNKLVSAVSTKDDLDKLQLMFTNLIDSGASIYFDNIKTSLAEINIILSDITTKCDHFNVSFEFDPANLCQQINTINENIDTLEKLKLSKELELSDRSNKFATILKGSIALEIAYSSLINDAKNSLSQKYSELKMAKDKNAEIDREITELKNSKADISDFADFLNEILESIGIDFYLSVEGKDYIIRHHENDSPLTVQMISEGECNLLALLIFYYELFEDDAQKKFKENIEYIILDDPISSIDDVNKIYILELINKILDCEHPQVFVFTHVWDDFCSMCYGRNNNGKKDQSTTYAFYEIKKDKRVGSYLEKTRTNETPYMHDFREIYEFSKLDSAENLSDCEIYHYPNVMRKVLEEYMKMKVADSRPIKSNINSVKIALCGGVQNCKSKDEIQIAALLDNCNLLSHKTERHTEQVLKSAKYLMRKIKEEDPLHFEAMTRETSKS